MGTDIASVPMSINLILCPNRIRIRFQKPVDAVGYFV
jgi:hypothetical protein